MQFFEVGGCVRDEILGLKSKDIDFTVVLENEEVGQSVYMNASPFAYMAIKLEEMGFEIFLETPEYLTIRARFPRVGYDKYKGLTADFVLARKESDYTDGRRPDSVESGTLDDDLARRDFTMNAIAKLSNGTYYDPHGGIEDIKSSVIRAVGDPAKRLEEDALRALRALRFHVTKRFTIDPGLAAAMRANSVADAIDKMADDRIRSELEKMFRFDTLRSIFTLYAYPSIMGAVFNGSVSLDATMKTKGRG